MAPLLSMRRIVKNFGQTAALKGIDFVVEAGEIHALLGENGAGKSTLMHVLAGLTTPDAGEIQMEGLAVQLDTPREARKHGIAMVHQHFTLVPAFTISENLALAEKTARINLVESLVYKPKVVAGKALDRAKELGWNLNGQSCIVDLSVGVQQRVEIIKALVTDARILIFDEPTAVLTGKEVEELFTVLRRLRAEGRAIILIAHKLAEIMAVGDRVTVLHQGKNVTTVPVAEVSSTQLALWMVSGTQSQTTSPAFSTETRRHSEPQLTELPAAMNALDEINCTPGKIVTTLATNPALRVLGLSVYGDRGEQALRDLDLQVCSGEILGIGGVDGNGQTELAEALVGLRPCKTGTITWNEKSLVPGVSTRIGYIPQDRRRAGLALSLSVEENLLFEAVRDRTYRWGPFLRRRKLIDLADKLIKNYDIRAESRSVPVSSLSGGNQQKIVVARNLSTEPELIVAVNPTRGLDIGATRFVHAQIRTAKARGAAIVLISTDLDEIAALADRQAILSSGRLAEFAPGNQDPVQIGLLLGGIGSS